LGEKYVPNLRKRAYERAEAAQNTLYEKFFQLKAIYDQEKNAYNLLNQHFKQLKAQDPNAPETIDAYNRALEAYIKAIKTSNELKRTGKKWVETHDKIEKKYKGIILEQKIKDLEAIQELGSTLETNPAATPADIANLAFMSGKVKERLEQVKKELAKLKGQKGKEEEK
jgi:hypothetical protein